MNWILKTLDRAGDVLVGLSVKKAESLNTLDNDNLG